MPSLLFRAMFILSVCGVLLAAMAPARAAERDAADQPSERPNILLILTDDQAWNGTSTAMDPRYPHSASDYYETPHITRLAHRGMRFSQAYSPAPICTCCCPSAAG